MKNFKSYELACEIYQELENINAEIKIRYFLRDQMLRASSSVVLNLAEGYGRRTRRDKRKFYQIAYGSCKELQAACLIIMGPGIQVYNETMKKIDQLGAYLWRLIESMS